MESGDRSDGVGAADGFDAGFGEAEVFYLALLNEVFYGAGDVFDGDGGVDTVLVKEVDGFNIEAFERGFGDAFDAIGVAGEAGLFAVFIEGEAELGGDDDPVLDGGEGFADEGFVEEGAVDFSGVEEGNAEIDGGVDEFDHFGFVGGGAVAKTHAHAAEAEGGDFEIACAEFAGLHIH